MAITGIGALLVELISGQRCLIPQAILAEIVPADPLQPISGAPQWLRGRFDWRGQQPVVVEPAVFCGQSDGDEVAPVRYAVIYALERLPGLNYYALPLAAIPRPMRLGMEDLVAEDDATLCELEAYRVRLHELDVAILDFAALERRLVGQLAAL